MAKGKDRNAPSVKFWLTPVTEVQNRGLNANELRKARQIVDENRELFLEMWDEYCND